MLNLLLVTLGLAWMTELAGLSLALGAFIAGCWCRDGVPPPGRAPTSAPSRRAAGPVLHHRGHDAGLA